MKKNLYSLILSDDVVNEVDVLAHQAGMSRSSMVNQILAEYCSVVTPEKRINDIFRAIENILTPSRELVPFFAPNALTMSLKSSLQYKYRPTVKYEVGLNRSGGDTLGELTVVFRTQSSELIACMADFFRLWKQIEDRYLASHLETPPDYALYDTRFVRSIAMPRGGELSSESIAQALSDYIQLFDRLLKGYLAGRLSVRDVETEYVADLA
ncbi:MAG: CopG family transcriptional regulator, partial [Oscillospiraceae bacterium]